MYKLNFKKIYFAAAENEEESENEEQEKRLESSEENSLLYTTAESEAIAQHQESASEEESLSAPAVDIPDMSVTKMSDPCKTDIVTAEELPTEPTINEIEVDKLSGQTQEEIVEDASVDGRESTQVMYDSDSLQETTLDLQEGDQKNDESYQQETEDYQYETPNQDQSTIDLGLSDHDQSVDYSSCQQPPELIKSIPLETTELQTENVTTDKLYVTENESIVKPSQDASMENLSQSSIQSDVELEMGTGGIDAVSEEKGTDQNQTKVSSAKFMTNFSVAIFFFLLTFYKTN